LPGAPAIVEGLVDLRGRPCAVLDIRARFGLPARLPSLSDHLLVADAGPRRVGFRVDAVERIEQLGDRRIDAVPGAGPAEQRWVGVVRLADGLVLIHEPAAFLASAEAEALDDAVARLAGSPS